MDLDEAWADTNLREDDVPTEYIRHQSELIRGPLPGSPDLHFALLGYAGN